MGSYNHQTNIHSTIFLRVENSLCQSESGASQEVVMPEWAMDHEEPDLALAEKTSWFKSPLVPGCAPHLRPRESIGDSSAKEAAEWEDDGHYDGYPPFQRYEEPTLLEILYDLFFAANYDVFSQNQSVTNHQRFQAYFGYFSLLWGTWFIVTLYDVRYVTNSIFERMARAIQLGVLVGFAVVAPNFDPEDQDKGTMMTMSLILCASRVCLAVEYTHTLAHVFRYRRARIPLCLQIAINIISAAVYLGVTFRFEKQNSHVYVTWYIFTAGEAILTLILSNWWRTLSFTRTHLMQRLSLFTVMILGEGIQSVAQNIVTIVKTPSAWNAYTIGVITAATATIYFVFLVYFDWMRQIQLPPLRQQLWTALHYPFHLSLVLFMQGFTQLILWGKAYNVFFAITNSALLETDYYNLDDGLHNATSQGLADALRNNTAQLLELYPPKYQDAWAAINGSLANISTIPNTLWSTLDEADKTGNDALLTDDVINQFAIFTQQLIIIVTTLANAVFNSFNIDVSTDLQQKHPNASNPLKASEYQVTISDKTAQRSRLVFAYTYVACGCALFLLVIMALVSRMSPLGRWPRIRFLMCALLGIAIALTAVVFYDHDKADDFASSPWPIPTLLFGWLAATVLVHIRGRAGLTTDTMRNVASLFRWRKSREQLPPQTDTYSLRVPLGSWTTNRANTDISTARYLSRAGTSGPDNVA